ncbi:Ldh family oxidoreductase [Streptomyces iranensis]|uniref:LDH2 family malate/lactate/ureidoglycolate dehydrogenase n=1 Tax=Streptomyces iranensis TaxID=576784 RepID=A0A061A5Y9_9ACTN|nr:Ldh family oxidoreductase [Streptomyces iranensis]MBP2063632.1 LDH2 family malate/lactate/ureidoglycolate dehydrogenase [Streptomyces iranensis]CDR17779.1 Malate/L-lactate dehydrogenase [Streptomyces iranensis]
MTALSLPDARALVAAAMTSCGHSAEAAETIADHLLDCELRGLSFGGLARALSIAERIRTTEAPPRPIRVVAETPVSATVDGGDQVGYLVGRHSLRLAMAKARAQGVAVVGAYNTWYTGMFSYYLEKAAAAGLAGMIAGSGPAVVAPHGGTEARFGTNPIAFGFPATPTPVIWDIGTSAVMYGEVRLKARLGEKLAPGQAYDAAGAPTLDPDAALEGAFGVWGAHKGSGLALVVQLLGMMTGAAADPPGVSDCGFFVVLVDPGVLTDPDDYRQRVAAFAESVRATRPVEDGRAVRMPFDRSASRRNETLRRGAIDVPEAVVAALRKEAAGG